MAWLVMMHVIVYGHIDTFNNDKDDLRSVTKEGTRKKQIDYSNREVIYLPFNVKNIYIKSIKKIQ